MADLDLTDATESAAEALWRLLIPELPWSQAHEAAKDACRADARTVLDAALPHLQRQLREQIAREVEASPSTMEAGQ